MVGGPIRLGVVSTALSLQPGPTVTVQRHSPCSSGSRRVARGCASPAACRLLLSKSELCPLRHLSMTPAAGSLDVRWPRSSTCTAARRPGCLTNSRALLLQVRWRVSQCYSESHEIEQHAGAAPVEHRGRWAGGPAWPVADQSRRNGGNGVDWSEVRLSV